MAEKLKVSNPGSRSYRLKELLINQVNFKDLKKKQDQESINEDVESDTKEIFTAQELCNTAEDNITFLLEPIFPAAGLGFLTGGSDTNKSTLLRQLASAIVTGDKKFLGFKLNVIHKRVLMIITEDDKNNIAVFLKNSLAESGQKDEFKNFYLMFSTGDVPKKIKRFLSKTPVDAVILIHGPIRMLGTLMLPTK